VKCLTSSLGWSGSIPSKIQRKRKSIQRKNPKSQLRKTGRCSILRVFATAYAFGIARRHPFADGNKRMSFITCRMFLILNGHALAAACAETLITFVKLAEGRLREKELTAWNRDHLQAV